MSKNETRPVDPPDAAPAADPPIDPAQTHLVAEFRHEKPLTTCRVDPQGRFVFAGAEDLQVYRWDLRTGEQVSLAGHESWVRSMDFSLDGDWLYTAGWDGQLRWWETAADQPRAERFVQAHRGFARWVQTSPCGTMLVTCGNDKFIRLWDANNGEKLAEMAGHQRHPYAVVFHPQAGQLASQDLLGQIHIWDLPAAALVTTIDASVMTGYDNKFAADMGGARDMRFSPCGSTLATAGITNVVNSFAGQQDPIIVLVDWARKAITHHLRPPEKITGIAWGVRFHPAGFIVGAIAQQNGRGRLAFWRTDESPPRIAENQSAGPPSANPSSAGPPSAQQPIDTSPFHSLALDKCARGLDLRRTPAAWRLHNRMATSGSTSWRPAQQTTAELQTSRRDEIGRTLMPGPRVQQQRIPDELFGRLKEYPAGQEQDGPQLQRHLEQDGYLLLRRVLDRQAVVAAREEVFSRLEQVGEVQSPALAGIATGQSRRRELASDLHEFWRSVNTGPALRKVTHGDQLRQRMAAVFGETARPHDLMYLRPACVGRCTKLHYDFPFFARRSLRIHTAWVPLGDIPLCDGPLLIVEGSNRFSDLIDPIRNHDYEALHGNDVVQRAAYERANASDPVELARHRETRLLSTDFQAGDLLVFGGFTLHGSLDNCSPGGRIRLSCDVRYQPAADPYDDPRYFGPDPTGSNGGGYGDMKGARPVTDPW